MDHQGTRWRRFSSGEPPQDRWVNMSVLEPFLRVLSHGGTAHKVTSRSPPTPQLRPLSCQVTMETG